MRLKESDLTLRQIVLATTLVLALALLMMTGCGDSNDSAGGTSSTSGGAGASQSTPENSDPVAAPIYSAATDQDSYLAGRQATATFANRLDSAGTLTPESAYLPGCSPFFIQRLSDGRWSTIRPLYVCIQEGIAVEVAAGDSHTTIGFTTPIVAGLYRLRYDFSLGCDSDLPLSLANCESEEVIFSNEFKIDRALCDPAESGCAFMPAAPLVQCENSLDFEGPSDECTRDPNSGLCGYENLTCL